MNPNEMVRVRNTDDKPFVSAYEGKKYIIHPKTEAFIPWGAACIWFGNPETQNTERGRVREDEWKHLMSKYGVFYHTDRNELLPRCEVYSLNAGEDGSFSRIYMVLDDPDGSLGAGVSVPTTAASTSDEVLKNRVVETQGQLAALIDVLKVTNPETYDALIAAGVISGQPASPVPDGDTGEATSTEPAFIGPQIPLPTPPEGATVDGVPVDGPAGATFA